MKLKRFNPIGQYRVFAKLAQRVVSLDDLPILPRCGQVYVQLFSCSQKQQFESWLKNNPPPTGYTYMVSTGTELIEQWIEKYPV